MNTGDECWLEDGRKAAYAGEIDGQPFVRILLSTEYDDEYYQEWPSDKLTPVGKILSAEPTEVRGPFTRQNEQLIAELIEKRDNIVREIAELEAKKAEMDKAAAKWPDIRLALDFFEGVITHVVEYSDYSGPKVVTLSNALKDTFNDHREGSMKLLGLFGGKGKSCWRINQYSDGSGVWKTILPVRGLGDAQTAINGMFDSALVRWRDDKLRLHSVLNFGKGEFAIDMPDDVMKAGAIEAQRIKDDRIADAQKKLAEAEALPGAE